MERIWAPWRMEYISTTKCEDGCIFCDAWNGKNDREKLVLFRTGQSLIMLNRYPYSSGHLMAAPVRHSADLDDLCDVELLDLMKAVRLAVRLLKHAAAPHGFNIGINLGKAAGAGVEDHLHIHIVPRWNGDTNFMTVIGDVRVIPEELMACYDLMVAGLATLKGEQGGSL